MRRDYDAERDSYGSCVNTWAEEFKQQHYAPHMGLSGWPHINLAGRSVLDLGGGPASMLLKTVKGKMLTVVDPCEYPVWVRQRYRAHGVHLLWVRAERFTPSIRYDECWIYNTLPYVEDPERVARVALESSRQVRVFEWLNVPVDDINHHELTTSLLDGWFGRPGSEVFGVNMAWGEPAALSWSLVTR